MSVSLIGTQPQLSDQQLIDAVKAELAGWFGQEQVDTWEPLRTYRSAPWNTTAAAAAGLAVTTTVLLDCQQQMPCKHCHGCVKLHRA